MQDRTAELMLRERSSGQSALDTVVGVAVAEHAGKHDDSQQVYSEVWERGKKELKKSSESTP